MTAKKPMSTARLVVTIIATIVGIIVLAIALFLGVPYYMLQSKFSLKGSQPPAISDVAASSTVAADLAPSASEVAISTIALEPDAAPAHLNKEVLISSANGRFIHDKSLELVGYYFPKSPVQAGHFRLAHIDMGSNDDLLKFEKEGQTIPTWTPFMLSFDDMTSKIIQSDSGPYRKNSSRVFCTSYRISRDVITFEGYDKQVGKVTFSGKIDPAFAARKSNYRDEIYEAEYAVLIGDLTVGDKTFKGITFDYFIGE